MSAKLRHSIVLLVSDDRGCEDEIAAALAVLGCIAHRHEHGAQLEVGQRYDAALLVAQRNSRWSAALLDALRSTEIACASLILLDAGGPDAITESLRFGAVDCLIRPVSETELIESLAGVIDCTRMWRARVSRARLTATLQPLPSPTRVASPLARVFEPAQTVASQAADTTGDERIEGVVARVGDQSGLTPRERQVLYWLLIGHRYVDIASILGVAPRTAKFHAANLLHKLDLDSRHDLSRLLAEEIEREQA